MSWCHGCLNECLVDSELVLPEWTYVALPFWCNEIAKRNINFKRSNASGVLDSLNGFVNLSCLFRVAIAAITTCSPSQIVVERHAVGLAQYPDIRVFVDLESDQQVEPHFLCLREIKLWSHLLGLTCDLRRTSTMILLYFHQSSTKESRGGWEISSIFLSWWWTTLWVATSYSDIRILFLEQRFKWSPRGLSRGLLRRCFWFSSSHPTCYEGAVVCCWITAASPQTRCWQLYFKRGNLQQPENLFLASGALLLSN